MSSSGFKFTLPKKLKVPELKQKYLPKILNKSVPSKVKPVGHFLVNPIVENQHSVAAASSVTKTKNRSVAVARPQSKSSKFTAVPQEISGPVVACSSKPLRSALRNPLESRRNDYKRKKVTFAPGTVNHCQELKPYKYHLMHKVDQKKSHEYPTLRSIFCGRSITSNLQFDKVKAARLIPNSLILSSATRPTPPPTSQNEGVQSNGSNWSKRGPDPGTQNQVSSDGKDAPSTTTKSVTVTVTSAPLADKQSAGESHKSLQQHSNSKQDEDDKDLQLENEYVTFTHARRTYEYLSKTSGPSATRAQRLSELMDDLKKGHIAYNSITDIKARDDFLLDQIIIRYIMALDLALTENYTGFAVEVAFAMADTIQHMLPLYSHLFYNSDGSRVNLPILVTSPELSNVLPSTTDQTNNSIWEDSEAEDYIQVLGQIVSCLNRISQNCPRNDNNFANPETLLVKLQLEMITLIICPIKSAMFRAILEVVTKTALESYTCLLNKTKPNQVQVEDAVNNNTINSDNDNVRVLALAATAGRVLVSQDDNPIRWVNNSSLYKDYVTILRRLGLADAVGCLSLVPGITVDPSTFHIGRGEGEAKESSDNCSSTSTNKAKTKTKKTKSFSSRPNSAKSTSNGTKKNSTSTGTSSSVGSSGQSYDLCIFTNADA